MQIWKIGKRLLAMVVALALLLPNVLIPGVIAVDTNLTVPTTGIGSDRIVFVGTPSDTSTLPENTTPYATLEEALAALRTASGDAVIVIAGTVTVTASYNVSGTELTHGNDTYYITSKYLTYDFTADAVINFTSSSNIHFCFGGATHFSNVKLAIPSGSKKVMFYAHLGMTIGENVDTSGCNNDISIYGGGYLNSVASCDIVVSSGSWTTIMGGSNKTAITGKSTITIGGTAEIESNISTAYSKSVGSVEININGGSVNCIYSSPRDNGVVGDVTYNLNAGEIASLKDYSSISSATVGNVTVNLKAECDLGSVGTAWGTSGFSVGTKILNLTGEFTAVSSALWSAMDEINITSGSQVTYDSVLDTTPSVTVANGAKLTLTAADYADYTDLGTLPITNNGQVIFGTTTVGTADVIVFVGDSTHENYALLPEGAKVYASLAEAYQGLAGSGIAEAYILLFSSSSITASFNTSGTEAGWNGTYYISGKYSSGDISYDFGSDAVIVLSNAKSANFSPSGKQHFSNMKFEQSGAANINIYSSSGITIDSTVTYENTANGKTVSIYGGEYGAAVTETVINVYGGKWYSVRSGNSNSTVTNATINIGGNAVITGCIVPGGNKAASPVTKTVLNIEGGQVYQVYNSGLSYVVESLTINWTGGSTTLGLTQHASSGSAVGAMLLKLSGAVQFADGASITLPTISNESGVKLVLEDYTGDVPASASELQYVSVNGSSNVNYNETAAATFVVGEGATLNITQLTQTAAEGVITVTNNGGSVTYAGVEATYPEVVYVDGTGSGTKDGLSAANAVATLQEALALLDKTKGGTVVLCGELKVSSTTQYSSCGVTGPVTLTSVYDGVDYRATNGAKLTWAANKVKIGGTGNMTLDAMILNMESVDEGTTVASTISQYFYSAAYMYVTESVTVTGAGRLKLFVGDIGANAELDCEAILEGGTFYQIFVGSNSNSTGNATLTIDKNASVTSNVAMGGNSSSTVNGNAVLNMKGGYVKVIYDISNGGTVTGDIVLNLTGGSITEMRDYNGATGIVVNGNVIVTVGSDFNSGSGAFGAWTSSAVTVGGSKILNLIGYNGAALNSLDVYDVVNVFGSDIPGSFDTGADTTGKLLRIHDYTGIMGLDLSSFERIKLTGTDSYVTFQGKVPTGDASNPTALIVDDGCTMLIRTSVNPGVTLADYAITKLNSGTGEVILGEAAFVGSTDLILDVDFENSDASDASGKGNNGVITGSPAFVEGIDGGKAIYINNAFGKNAATQYITFADIDGVNISTGDYTVSFWYHTVNGGNTSWASSSTTAGAEINLNSVSAGGVVLSNQDVVSDGSGISAVQLPRNQYFAMGATAENGKHYDKDGIRSVTDDTWHMITISVDRAGYYTVYVDGELETSKGISLLNGQTLGINTLVLGADINGKYGLENAYIDNLRLFAGVMNPIDVQAYYAIDSTKMLIKDAESSIEQLGKAYETYKPGMTETINTVKQTMETVTEETYAKAASAYVVLKSAYEAFLAAPQEYALLSAVMLSDIHIKSEGDTNSQRFEMVFKDLSELGITPDIFINAGDFSDDSSKAAYDAAFDVFESLKEKYDMDMPMFLAQGNHEVAVEDDGGYSTTAPIYDERMLENLASYIASGKIKIDSENFDRNIKINDWQYTVDYGYVDFNGNSVIHNANRGYSYGMTYYTDDGTGYHIVILNTDNIEQTGRSKDYTNADGSYSAAANFLEPFRHGCKFLDDTITWLDKQMAEYAEDGLPIFVINHFPFADSCPLATYSTTVIDDNSIGMQDAQIRAVLAKYEDVFTFSGHLHHNLGIASITDVVDSATGNSFTQVNMPAIKNAVRAYENIPANWLMFVYEDEVVFRARDYSTGEWLTQFDVVVKLTGAEEAPDYGDADGDGDVTAEDAALLKKYRAGLAELSEDVLVRCDLDNNGRVDAYDAYLIQLRVAGKIDKFPIEN